MLYSEDFIAWFDEPNNLQLHLDSNQILCSRWEGGDVYRPDSLLVVCI